MASSPAPGQANVGAPPPAGKQASAAKWKPGDDIASRDAGNFVWKRGDILTSLDALSSYVLAAADRSESWYWAEKGPKARMATVIQWTAVSLTGFAGLWPIAAKLLFPALPKWISAPFAGVDSGLLASLLIGAGAAFLGIDRVAGISSGWTRYVLTATAIRAAMEEFRMDWAALSAQLSTPPQPEQIAAMIQRAKVFRLAIEALIAKETQDWATEFRQNMNSLERDLKVQVDQAKTDRDKADQDAKAQATQDKADQAKADQPGAIEVNVTNASGADDFQFRAKLENKADVVVEEAVSGSETWTHIELPAGQYKLTIHAVVNKKDVSSTTVVVVKPGETSKSELSLPGARIAPAPPVAPAPLTPP
jgi:hypothetical protein